MLRSDYCVIFTTPAKIHQPFLQYLQKIIATEHVTWVAFLLLQKNNFTLSSDVFFIGCFPGPVKTYRFTNRPIREITTEWKILDLSKWWQGLLMDREDVKNYFSCLGVFRVLRNHCCLASMHYLLQLFFQILEIFISEIVSFYSWRVIQGFLQVAKNIYIFAW